MIGGTLLSLSSFIYSLNSLQLNNLCHIQLGINYIIILSNNSFLRCKVFLRAVTDLQKTKKALGSRLFLRCILCGYTIFKLAQGYEISYP